MFDFSTAGIDPRAIMRPSEQTTPCGGEACALYPIRKFTTNILIQRIPSIEITEVILHLKASLIAVIVVGVVVFVFTFSLYSYRFRNPIGYRNSLEYVTN
jgi:hypothetical protein